MFPSQSVVRRAHRFSSLLILVVASAACASTQQRELADLDFSTALDLRADAEPAPLDERALAGLDALALPRPTSEECADPRTAGYWRACALAWNPGVRSARRELQRTRVAAG